MLHEREPPRQQVMVFGAPAAIPPAAPTAAPSDENPGRGQRTAAIAVGAGGVVLIAAGAVFGGLALSKWSDAKNACSDRSCPGSDRPQAVTDRAHAVTFGDLSTVGLIAGGVLAAGAVTLYLTAPKSASSDAPAPQVSVSPSIGGGSLRVTF